MFKLQPVFLPCADPLFCSGEQSAATGVMVSSETGGIDSLTLEFRDSPVKAMMRMIARLADRDPKEALRLAENALDSRLAEGMALEMRLRAQADELRDRLREAPLSQQHAAGPVWGVVATGLNRC